MLFTVDGLVENIHYMKNWLTPFEIGRKLFRINLSDISAMGGGELIACSVAAGIVKQRSYSRYYQVLKGIKYEADKFKIKAFSGDTDATKFEYFYLSIIAMTKETPILRQGCKNGELLCLTGKIGAAAIAIKELKMGIKNSNYINLFKLPPIRLNEALKIKSYATSMIDISDGLARSIELLAQESKCGFDIFVDKIPFISYNYKPEFLIKGGEDYELLFTIKESNLEKLKVEFSVIGVATKSGINYLLNNKKLNIKTYEKF
ncbi:MAG: thiamine-phosphate kinase [bacterium]|nr:thiamine-phosphate kinase [bacterium]